MSGPTAGSATTRSQQLDGGGECDCPGGCCPDISILTESCCLCEGALSDASYPMDFNFPMAPALKGEIESIDVSIACPPQRQLLSTGGGIEGAHSIISRYRRRVILWTHRPPPAALLLPAPSLSANQTTPCLSASWTSTLSPGGALRRGRSEGEGNCLRAGPPLVF